MQRNVSDIIQNIFNGHPAPIGSIGIAAGFDAIRPIMWFIIPAAFTITDPY